MSLNLVNPFRFGGVPPPPVLGNGHWVEIDRSTLGVNASDMDVTVTNKKYFMYLYAPIGGTGIVNGRMRFNNITGNDYAIRFSTNGGADSTQTVQADGIDLDITGNTNPKWSFGVISNFNNTQKLVQCWNQDVNTVGAGTAPQRREVVGKMDITTDTGVITTIKAETTANLYLAGSELVILGWDADSDTHNTGANFWQPLADVDLAVAADNMNVTIPARKYLFLEAFVKPVSGVVSHRIRFNGLTTNIWAIRQNINGSESTATNTDGLNPVTSDTNPAHWYGYMVNNSAQEKFLQTFGNNFGAGAGVSPIRRDSIAKVSITGSQITSIEYENTNAGDYDTGSFFRVWGSD